MIRSHFTCMLCAGILFTGTASAAPAPKSNQIMILGVWEVTKSDDGTPPGTTVEFTRDGKIKIKTKVGDETLEIAGTYKLEGDKVTVIIKAPDDEESIDTLTITKLTDKELIFKDQKGKIDRLKRKK